jgi:hypothetical protein
VIDVGHDFERMREHAGGRLSEEEHQAFEERLLRDPGLVHEYEVSLRLTEGLQQLREQRHFLENAAMRGLGIRIWLPALAAAVLAGVALWLWVQSTNHPVLTASIQSHPARSAPAVTAHFTFVALRGNSVPDLTLPQGGLIEFRAAPAAHTEGSRYTVSLTLKEGERPVVSVGTLTGLAVLPDGFVHYYADATRLQPGAYLLRIESDIAGSGSGQTYRFNLLPGAAP